jgi:hypothetical protein
VAKIEPPLPVPLQGNVAVKTSIICLEKYNGTQSASKMMVKMFYCRNVLNWKVPALKIVLTRMEDEINSFGGKG